jgi:hypothetical protein
MYCIHTYITIKAIKTNFRAFPSKALMAIRRMKIYIKRYGRYGKTVTTFWFKQLQGRGHVGDKFMHAGAISNGYKGKSLWRLGVDWIASRYGPMTVFCEQSN